MSHSVLSVLAISIFVVLLAHALVRRDRAGVITNSGMVLCVVASLFLGPSWLSLTLTLLGMGIVVYGWKQQSKQQSKPELGR